MVTFAVAISLSWKLSSKNFATFRLVISFDSITIFCQCFVIAISLLTKGID